MEKVPKVISLLMIFFFFRKTAQRFKMMYLHSVPLKSFVRGERFVDLGGEGV